MHANEERRAEVGGSDCWQDQGVHSELWSKQVQRVVMFVGWMLDNLHGQSARA